MRSVTTLGVLVLSMALGGGCADESRVDVNQPAERFKADVEKRIESFESRIDGVRDHLGKLPRLQRDEAMTQVEAAEKRLQTLRDTMLGQLEEVSGQSLEDTKRRINETLSSIDDHLDEAEDAVSSGLPDREAYAVETRRRLDQLRSRLDDLRDRAEGASEQVKSRLQPRIEQMEQEAKQAGDALENYGQAAKDSAADLRDDLDAMVEKLEDKLQAAEKELSQ